MALPPRREVLRYGAAALVLVVLALIAVNDFLYPTADPSELGWWATPVGEVVSYASLVVALPALPAVFLVGFGLPLFGVPEGLTFFAGALIGSFVGAAGWGWLIAASVSRLRSHRAV